jgi:hypothetical protein
MQHYVTTTHVAFEFSHVNAATLIVVLLCSRNQSLQLNAENIQFTQARPQYNCDRNCIFYNIKKYNVDATATAIATASATFVRKMKKHNVDRT